MSCLCASWRIAGLKGDEGGPGDCEGFSSLTPTRLALCPYAKPNHTELSAVATHRHSDATFLICLHASWSVKVTAVPLDETEAFEANASLEERGFHAGSLNTENKTFSLSTAELSSTTVWMHTGMTTVFQSVVITPGPWKRKNLCILSNIYTEL